MSFILRIIIVLFLTLLLQIYLYKKFKNSVKSLFVNSDQKFKKFLLFSIFYLNLYLVILLCYWIYIQITGQSFRLIIENKIWDFLILYPFWIYIIWVLQLSFLLLPLDLIKMLFFIFLPKEKQKILRVNYIISLILISFFIIYVPSRVIYDFKSVDVRSVEYKKQNLPDVLNEFKIILIGDIQADWYNNNARLSNFINKVNSTKPDLILIAGDLITGTPDYIPMSAYHLSRLKSTYGVFSCVGDHDNWAYRKDNERSRKEIAETLKKYEIAFLDNEIRKLNIGSAEVGISFVTESYSKRIDGNVLDSLNGSIKTADLKIVLTHQPTDKIIRSSIKNEMDLMLAGHTHGGQITFLFPFINITPTLLETKYVKGDFYFNDLLLIVTRGLGMSLAPIRYNSSPEIVIVTVKKK